MTRVCAECFGNSILKRRVTELCLKRQLSSCTFHPACKGVLMAKWPRSWIRFFAPITPLTWTCWAGRNPTLCSAGHPDRLDRGRQ